MDINRIILIYFEYRKIYQKYIIQNYKNYRKKKKLAVCKKFSPETRISYYKVLTEIPFKNTVD